MKLIASDYDGTFYINDDDIKVNIEAVKNFQKENIFVLATGRSYVDAHEAINLYNIPYDYLIIDHGATIIKNNIVIYRKQIDNTIKNELVIDLKKREFTKSIGYDTIKDNLFIEDNNLTKMHIKYISRDDVRYIDDIIKRKYSDKINAYWMHNNMAVEIVSKDADKANAIRD